MSDQLEFEFPPGVLEFVRYRCVSRRCPVCLGVFNEMVIEKFRRPDGSVDHQRILCVSCASMLHQVPPGVL